MKPVHIIQMQILKKLLFSPSLRFTELKPNEEIENNQFTFHLDKMIEAGYVEKKDNLYFLTSTGKEYANRMDTDITLIKPQAKLSVVGGCIRQLDNETEYLIYTRLKHPFFNCQGLFSGKITYGEKAIETINRELKEETNLTGNPELVKIRHYRVNEQDTKKIVEDKFMFIYRILNPRGDLIGSNEGKYEWVKESELDKYIDNPIEPKDELFKILYDIKNFENHITFEEVDHWSDKF